jgi:hypothetical protein
MSPDWIAAPEAVPYADLSDPQTLNLYGYVGNNPMSRIDPNGHECFADGSCNYLRNPLPNTTSWGGVVANATSNTVSDLLMLDSVAHNSQTLGDSSRPTLDRVEAGGKLAGITLINTVGGEIFGKALSRVLETSTQLAARLGAAGEAAAGFARNTERIASATGSADYRVPDILNHDLGIVGEVKNVSKQGLTAQLKDGIAYAKANNYNYVLVVDTSTKISKPLQKEIDSGSVELFRTKMR